MIEIRNLVKQYGSNMAVKNISFDIEDGKIYGFLGPNGAGKSTTMNIITGCLAATSGSVKIQGHDIYDEPRRAKECIGYLPEIPPLYMDMTPREYLSFVGEAKGLRGSDLQGQIQYAMEVTQITDVCSRIIKNLSKGYKQRVGIAQALLGNPPIIILDEPTVGLDPKQIVEIRELIKNLAGDHTVILSSHILAEVSSVCDHIIIINNGSIVANDTKENLTEALAGEATIELTVKAPWEDACTIMNGIHGVGDYDIKEAEISGAVNIVFKPEDGTDPREEIFFAFSKKQWPILDMHINVITLEDVFLRLTAGEEHQSMKVFGLAKPEEEDESASELSPTEEETEKTKGNDSDDDYKPLFS